MSELYRCRPINRKCSHISIALLSHMYFTTHAQDSIQYDVHMQKVHRHIHGLSKKFFSSVLYIYCMTVRYDYGYHMSSPVQIVNVQYLPTLRTHNTCIHN